MKVIFKDITYKNFRSVGNTAITVNLNTHKTTLITGINGSGKTLLLHAICFALFGRGYGEINKPELINSINKKQLVVTLNFSIESKSYKIVRGMKPNIFQIFENDILLNQDPSIKDYQKYLEQNILKFNYRAFTQVVIIGGGSDYTPFMRLSSKDRREFVEDLLDIRVFSVMSSILKDEIKSLKDELKCNEFDLKNIKEKIELQESFIKRLKSDREDSTDKLEEKIYLITEENKTLHNSSIDYQSKLTEAQLQADLHYDIDDKLSSLRISKKNVLNSLSKINSKKEAYNNLSVCPTCSQSVNEEHKKSVIDTYTNEYTELNSTLYDIEAKEKILNEELKELQPFILLVAELNIKVSEINTSIFSNNKLIRNLFNQIESLKNNTDNIDDEQLKLKKFAKEFISITGSKKKTFQLLQYKDAMQQILSDSGIKSKIIKQYIPTINKYINKHLEELDFFCNFNLDEQFNETIKSRHRDTFTYNNFSDGQKRRIDLAILLAWTEIAKSKNSLHTNIICFDEIDSVLDAEGSELFLKLIKSKTHVDNIFVISHKIDMLMDKVDNVIKFRLHNNFTERLFDI
jgi:DNA repair exonuclease SbcCD ATPase subunit